MNISNEISKISGWLRTARTNNINGFELCRRIADQLRFKFSLWVINHLKGRSVAPHIQYGDAADNILICNLDNLGDAIRITPAIRAIKHKWPHAHLTILASDYNETVFQNNPHIANRYILKRYPGPIKTLNLISELRKMKFSHSFVFCFGPSVADYCAFVSKLAGIPVRVGFDNVAKPELLTYRQMRTSETNHIELLKHIIMAIGIEPVGPSKELFVTKEEENIARGMVRQSLMGHPDDPIMVVAPGGFGHVGYTVSRVWPAEHFRQLVMKTIECYPQTKVVITGNNRDCKTADIICKGLNLASVINLTNKINVRQLAALLKIAAVVITNDNGTLHLADAVSSRYVICVTGPTDPLLMLESGSKNIHVVRKKLLCGPCITVSAFLECTCPEGQICLSELAVDDVFFEVRKALEA